MAVYFRNFSILLLYFLMAQQPLWSQQSKQYAHNSLAEKIYLQLDNEVYTADKTIWFKAILVNAVTHEPTFSSGVLYVDLINAESEIVDSKLIRINVGIGHGHFDLDRSFKRGVYKIRAYTEWNKNFDKDFVFEKYIRVYPQIENFNGLMPIQNITLLDSTATMRRISARLHPEYIDTSHKGPLTVFVQSGTQVDSLKIRKGRNDEYLLEYDLDQEGDRISLGMTTNNGMAYQSEVSMNAQAVDIQFFPESGKLVDGLTSKVGFKAIDSNGKGLFVEGEVYTNEDELITTFKSNALGMGSFILSNVSSNSKYKVQVRTDNGIIEHNIPLPKVHTTGTVMTAGAVRDNIIVQVNSSLFNNESLQLKGQSRGYQYYSQIGLLKNGQYTFVIPNTTFPEGIVVFTLNDLDSNPVAERLVFNKRPDQRISLDARLNKNILNTRDKVRVDVSASDSNGDPLVANLSLLVVDSSTLKSEQSRSNLLSHLLLNSDLRGTIEQPGFYFTSGNDQDLDHLMLTQGWRNYKYTEPTRKLNHQIESRLSVTGVINSGKGNVSQEQMDLMLMTFDDERSVYTNSVKVPGTFNFQLDDIYGKTERVLIQPVGLSDKDKKKYRVAVYQRKPVPITFEYSKVESIIDSLDTKVVDDNRSFKQKKDQYYFDTTGMTELDKVIIEGYNMTPTRKKAMQRYGKPYTVIEGDEILEAKGETSSGLYNILLYSFRDRVLIRRDSTNNLYAETRRGGKDHINLYIVDGEPVLSQNIFLLQYLIPEEIASFEIIDNPKQLRKLYSIIYSALPPPGPFWGSIVSIHTRSGNGMYSALQAPRSAFDFHTIPVYSVEKEFYAPQHDSNSYYDVASPDLRLPIYWEPELLVNDEGKAFISYYHSDNTGDFEVIIEGITSSGEIGYQRLFYSVKEGSN